MPEFQYVGVDRSGKKVDGKVEAPHEGEVRMILRGQGVRPVRISKVGVMNQDLGLLLRGVTGGGVSTESLAIFTRQLHVLIGSGIPLVQALDALADQTQDRSLKSILSAIKENVSNGRYLWESLAQYPKVFPKVYVSLIRAGESSGALEVMLKRLSRYLEDADRLKKMMKSAAMYPIIVTGIGISVVVLMLTFVIPKFEGILRSSGQTLPGPTQFVIDLSHLMVDNIVYLTVGGLVCLYLGMRYFQSNEGRAVLHRVLFKSPLFGPLMQKAGTARFSRTMSTLLTAGVNLIDAIDICRATIDNVVLEEAVSRIRPDVEAGKTLGSVVGRLNVFPKMAVQMITVGESTGNLDSMLDRVAEFYEEEVETTVSGLSKLIEPIVLIVLGCAVGGLMIAMYLPIFKLAGSAT